MLRRLAAALIVGAIGGLVGLALMPPMSGTVGPGTVEMRMRTAIEGRTEVGVPPLGRLRADTHGSPVLLEAEVESVNIAELQELLLVQRPTEQFVEIAEEDLNALARRVGAVAVLVGGVGGAVAAMLVWHRRWRPVAIASVGGVVTVVALLGSTWASFDTDAFRQPTYTGALERAPAVVDTIGRHVESFSAVQAQVDTMGRQLAELYAVAFAESPQPTFGGARILHVSDIHSNPLALEIVARLAEAFEVDAVLDTGDLTSFGLPLEAGIAEQVESVDARYLFVPGNHDSEQIREAIGGFDNVEVLDDEVVDVDGLRILGIADPTFTASNETSIGEATDVIEGAAPDVARLVRRLDPDVLAVHNERQAANAYGWVPLVLHGHRHERVTEERDDTVRLGLGSTGATGLGYFTVDTDEPFEAQLLTFSLGCLVTQDYLEVRGIGGDLEVSRRTFSLVPDRSALHPTCVEPEE